MFAKPSGLLDRSREVLLVWYRRPPDDLQAESDDEPPAAVDDDAASETPETDNAPDAGQQPEAVPGEQATQ